MICLPNREAYPTERVSVLIVTYFPVKTEIIKLVESIMRQVSSVTILDNTPAGADFSYLKRYDRVHLHYFGANTGVGYAYNYGIDLVKRIGVDYVLLADQDSIFSDGYVDKALHSFFSCSKIVAVFPRVVDEIGSSRSEGFFVNSFFGWKRIYPDAGRHLISHGISSGMLIKIENLVCIGCFDERLFIDWVDFEWCWRAVRAGFTLVGNSDLRLEHCLGVSSINIGVRSVNLRDCMRHYYITRNAFYLSLHSSLPFHKKIFLFFRSTRYLIGYPLFSKPHLKNFMFVWKGLYHGIIGRLGQY